MNRTAGLLALILLPALRPVAHAAPVTLAHDGDAYALRRDGQPYFIRGAGGDEKLWGTLAANGGNSVRLWGDERLGAQLDLAARDGLTVTAGIWLPQLRQGFDYTDAGAVAALRTHVRDTVLRYKTHPALLLWALGNEVNDPTGSNLAAWTAINDLAGLVKELDPDHPVMTVVAEIGGNTVANFQRLCPRVDILGINSYGGVQSLGDRYRALGGRQPYVVTAFGPPGVWEIGKDAVGASPEPTSAEKADLYARGYQRAVLDQPSRCLGSYAFYWGQKQEVTPTWFSLFLADGTRLATVDALARAWTGRAAAHACPAVRLQVAGTRLVAPGTTIEATLEVTGAAGESTIAEWELVRDPEVYGTGGDAEPPPAAYPDAILRGDLHRAEVRLPAAGGLYRLLVTVRDAHGGGAVANVPRRVDAPMRADRAQPVHLPATVYGEGADAAVYAPSGWMGDTAAIRLDPAWPHEPHTGSECLRCEFAARAGWGGVAWQHPTDNWGERAGGYDLTGAKRLVFWARGDQGGETVDFKFGVVPRDRPYFDTAHGERLNVVLTPEWRRYEIPVGGLDLSRVVTGFVWSVASPGRPVVFYLDDIRWE